MKSTGRANHAPQRPRSVTTKEDRRQAAFNRPLNLKRTLPERTVDVLDVAPLGRQLVLCSRSRKSTISRSWLAAWPAGRQESYWWLPPTEGPMVLREPLCASGLRDGSHRAPANKPRKAGPTRPSDSHGNGTMFGQHRGHIFASRPGPPGCAQAKTVCSSTPCVGRLQRNHTLPYTNLHSLHLYAAQKILHHYAAPSPCRSALCNGPCSAGAGSATTAGGYQRQVEPSRCSVPRSPTAQGFQAWLRCRRQRPGRRVQAHHHHLRTGHP